MSPDNKHQLKKVFKQIDADGSGKIEFEELLIWWKKQKSKAKEGFDASKLGMTADAAAAAAAAEMFALFDADGSGEVDDEELAAMAIELGKPMSEEELEAAVAEMDHDRNGTIERHEFVKWWSEQGVGKDDVVGNTEEEEKLRTIWMMSDTDKSGMLNEAETREVFAAMGKNLCVPCTQFVIIRFCLYTCMCQI